MLEVIGQLVQALDSDRAVAYCRLVATRGSTPQKAGAVMLVFENGSQAGTLGGGCVEAEVKRRALTTIQNGQPTVERFQLDSDYGWDDGLICGGRMDVLVCPVQNSEALEYFRLLSRRVLNGDELTEAIVFGEQGNDDPAEDWVPTLVAFDGDANPLCMLNADESQASELAKSLKPISDRPRAYGVGQVAFLPLLPRCRLLIIGGGHVGLAVAELAHSLDFDVWIVDDRSDFVTEDRFPTAQNRIHGLMDDVLPNLDVTPDTYCLIVTRGHNHDEKALFHLASRGARYVGMIGSRRKIRLIMDDLAEEGVAQKDLDRVYAPVGLDIGSQTVPEIALSICAELVSHRNRQGDVLGRASTPRAADG